MMGLKTIYEYDDEIKMYDRMLDIFKKYIEGQIRKGGAVDYELLKYIHKLKKEKENLEFYRATQEAWDRCDDSKKGMSVEEFLKELERWCYD